MTEKNKELLNYILNGYSVEEIKKKMNLSSKQFLRRLHQISYEGYHLKRYFYIDGQSVYCLNKELNKPETFVINSTKSENEFLMISDTHFCSSFGDMNYMKEIYTYAKEHHIHTILHLGDLIAGVYTKKGELLKTLKEEYNTIDKQVKYVVENYPFDSKILNYMLLGNHDYYSLFFDGIDVGKKFENSRTDFISLGYGNCTVSIHNVNMNLIHRLIVTSNKPLNTNYISFYGHSHTARTEINDECKKILVPSLSNSQPLLSENAFPGALHITLKDSNQKITFVIKHLILVDKLKVANTTIIKEQQKVKKKKK